MANRFPLIVNPTTKKIEELASGDNLDLSSSNIYASGGVGTAGQYLKSNGTTLQWDTPGNVYLTGSQIISDKTFSNCTISGNTNNLVNIPNSALVNSYILVNGVSIQLGGSVTVADTNTTYSISAVTGSGSKQNIRLTAVNPAGSSDVILNPGTNVTLSRSSNEITINSSYVDTITRLKTTASPTYAYGDITLTASGSSTITQNGSVFDISSTYVDTITRLKGGAAGTLVSGDINLVQSGATTISQNANDIFISSQDTITRIKGGATGSFVFGDVTFIGANATSVSQVADVVTIDSTNTVTRLKGGTSGTLLSGDFTIDAAGASTVSQSGSTITINSTNTITRLRASGGTLNSGDFTIAASGASSVSQTGSTITISSVDNNTITTLESSVGGTPVTGAVVISASGAAVVSQNGNTINIDALDTNTLYTNGTGLSLTSATTPVFSLKNTSGLTNNRILKWDTTNGQLVNSNILDDGSTITISGNLNVTGTTTTVNSTNLSVADATIELRTGNNLVGADSGIQINRTTDGSGNVTAYNTLQWFESGGYWRSYNGSVSNRLVTENESQTLTQKTLTSPILVTPTLGVASATTINKVTITPPTSGATLTIAEGKLLTINNSVTLSGTDNSTISFGGGGTVAYITNKLSVFAATTSDEIRGIITDEVGTGKLVFATNPEFTTSITTLNTTFAVFNTTATTINAFGAATTINMGAATGNTNIKNNLTVDGNVTLSDNVADTITINGSASFTNEDIIIRGIRVGRGASGTDTNIAVGKDALRLVVGVSPGTQNVAVGTEALFSNTQGSQNVCVGYQAGKTNTTGIDNVAIGKGSLFSNTVGARNIAIGSGSLNNNILGTDNVCVGVNAGFAITGTGNVIIGPAPDGNSSNATFQPPQVTGNYQLVIGSSSIAWLRGDSNGHLVVPNNLGIIGTLTVEGTTTSINSRSIDIKAIQPKITGKVLEIGSVTTTTFTAIVTQGNTTISITSWGAGIIPGMVVVSQTDGITVPANTTIVSIDATNSTAVISSAVNLGTGNVTFQATGPSESSANGGGLLLKSTTDRTFQYATASTSWTSNVNLNVASGRTYKINGTDVLSASTLGSGVTNSSLTSLGTLTALTISSSGTAVPLTITNTGTGDCLVINDEASDTTPFKIDNAGVLYINNNITDTTGSTGSNNQVLTRRNQGGVEWKGINTLADPNTVTNTGASTDNAIARFDLATGKIIQNSGITISDTNVISTPGVITSTFATAGSASLTIQNDSATGLANSTFSITKTAYGGIHFNNAAGTGGAARQAGITWRGNTADEAQAGIYVINNNTIGTAMAFATTDNYTTGPQEALRISHTGAITAARGSISVPTGQGYQINGTNVLTASTLGSGVTTSSLTSVGSLTSLTVTGNLTVDTNTLFVDATNNRVGINTTTPGTGISLDVLGGEIRAGRIDSSSEGGQISYCRSTDNTTAWYQDVYGSTANPSFRTVDVTNSAVRTSIDSSGNFTPGADATQNLGSSSLRWANIYSADLQLSNEGSVNEVDGTWGQYTIQEGEEDLFLINRRSGRKYKFVLQEVV